jgi:hypothetical protein
MCSDRYIKLTPGDDRDRARNYSLQGTPVMSATWEAKRKV